MDLEDIEDVLFEVEKSFCIKLATADFVKVRTFGELCTVITNKIQGVDLRDCTNQQAFYKLRKAIAEVLLIDTNSIKLETKLEILFPRKRRRQNIREVGDTIGFQLNILQPKNWVTNILGFGILISIIALFINWKIALISLGGLILLMKLVHNLGKEFEIETIKEFVEKVARENYRSSRRNPLTINRNEIAQKIKELFKDRLFLEDAALRNDAPLFK